MGKWTEGIYCGPVASTARCVWRPGQMPEDYELYYGFSRYAMQLNELDSDEAAKLPLTDTRFRWVHEFTVFVFLAFFFFVIAPSESKL